MNDQLELKRTLFSLCENYVNQKIQTAQEAIDNAQNSANKETKSSSGDKYETGRSMMQLEIEKYSAQLHDGLNLKKALSNINVDKIYSSIQTGSLVKTNQGNFFLAISAGNIFWDAVKYMAISFSSPIGQTMYNKEANDEIDFRGKQFIIKSVF